MSTSAFKRKMKVLVGSTLGVAALALCTSSASAAPTLNTVAPDSGPFRGGTSVVLQGDFTLPENTPGLPANLNNYEVYFSADATLDTAADTKGFVLNHNSAGTQINAVTPEVAAPGQFNVFVRVSNTVVPAATANSNSVGFNFTASTLTRTQAVAAALQSNFSALDTNNDGFISPAEAAAAGTTQAQFNEIDTNNDGVLSAEEIAAAVAVPTVCDRFSGLLSNFTLLGIIAFLLSIFEDLRRAIFGSRAVFPGNPDPGAGMDDESSSELGNG